LQMSVIAFKGVKLAIEISVKFAYSPSLPFPGRIILLVMRD